MKSAFSIEIAITLIHTLTSCSIDAFHIMQPKYSSNIILAASKVDDNNDIPEVYPLSRKKLMLVDEVKRLNISKGSYSSIGWSNRLGSVITPAAIPGVYTVDRPFYWNKIDVGCRCTIIQLSSEAKDGSKELLIHSPVGLDPPLIDAVTKLGTAGSDGLTNKDDNFDGEGKRVYLDKHGNLSYNNSNNLHARRMWNSYKRYLKCPCLVLFIVCAIGGLYSLFILTGNAIVNVNGIHLGGNKEKGEGYNETKFEGGEWVEDDIRGKDHNEEEEVLIEPEEQEVVINLSDNLSSEQQAKVQSIEKEIQSLQYKEQQIYEASIQDENLAKVVDTLEDPIENEISALKQKEEEIISSGTHDEEESAQVEGDKPVLQATPQKQRFDHIRVILLSHKVSNPLLFEDKQTPQYAALNWLTNVDERQLDPKLSGNVQHIIQRYGLAVIWFGTVMSGYDWQSSASATEDEEGDNVTTPTLDISNAIDEVVESKENGNTRRRLRQRRRILQSTEQQDTDHKIWFRHSNWLSSDGICSWEGISCHPHDKAQQDVHNPNNDGDVSHIQLRRNNLHGLIPDEVYTAFEYLNVLDLSDNGLAGTISEINKWNSLQVLNYTSNNLAGSIPSNAMDGWHSLKELHLGNNLLDGSIPHTIGSLSNLKHLNLAGNSIKGTIPYELGQLSNLSTLDLSYNLLVGELPHELSNLVTLVTLNVGNNDLGGPLITELKHTKFIQKLILNDNHFSGELPGSELGSMDHLDELVLNNNDFRGTLPKEISNLIGLGMLLKMCLPCSYIILISHMTSSTDKLNLANNHFEGEFPPEWTEMASLRELDISSNELQGPLPVFIGSMKNLRSLNMAHNKLTSSIPRSIGGLNKLENLFMDDNEFGSDVPTEMGQLSNLKILSLHNNYLIGTIDDRICKLSSELFLTQLSADCGGEIPEILCDCCMCQGKHKYLNWSMLYELQSLTTSLFFLMQSTSQWFISVLNQIKTEGDKEKVCKTM